MSAATPELISADPDLSRQPLLAGVIEAWLRPEQADFLEKG